MHKTSWVISGIAGLAFVLRMAYCWNLPLSGDESVSLLQAAGKALEYRHHIPKEPTPADQIRTLMEYSPEYGLSKVLKSMEKEGMHPPFYYLVLHWVLRLGIDSVLLLRLFSILFSTASVYLLYRIGKDVQDEWTGWIAAALLALSAYGIYHSGMVRPYPLLMLLSLLSTGLILKTERQTDSRPFAILLGLYTATIAIGLYTLYHFLFVVCFQIFYCLCVYRNNIRRLAALSAAWGLAALLYLPWIPSLREQIHVVHTGTYYFHTTCNPLKFLAIIYNELFARHLFERYGPIWITFFFLAAPAALIGLWKGFRSCRMRRILIALIGCIAVNLLADWKMNSHTLATPKFLFFVLPMGLVVLASGLLACRAAGIGGKIYAAAVAGLLCIHSLAGFQTPQTIDGPFCLNTFAAHIGRLAPSEKPTRIFLNDNNGRFVLSFAHAARFPCEIMAIEDMQSKEDLFTLPAVDSCHSLALVYFADIEDKTPLPRERKESLIRLAEQAGFGIIQSAPCRCEQYEDYLLLLTRKRAE